MATVTRSSPLSPPPTPPRRWTKLVGITAVFGVGLATWHCAARRPSPAATGGPEGSATGAAEGSEPAAMEGAVVPPRTATFGAEVMGINEAITLPRPWIERGLVGPEDEVRALGADATLAVGLGVGIVRANTAVYPYLDMQSRTRSGWDWTRPDRWVAAAQGAGLDAVVMLGPWPGTQTARYTERYLPDDLAAYAAYVTRVVERYDGDGVDDMPGLLRPIKSWEVDNEPDLHNRVPPRGGGSRVDPATFETPDEYAEVVVRTAAAVRAADPTARVLAGGFYNIRAPYGSSYARELAALPGVLAAIDVVSLHCYSDDDNLDAADATMRLAREIFPGKAVWITETSVGSEGDHRWQSEAWQARQVVGIYGAFLAGGADRVFWHTLTDPPPNPRRNAAATEHNSLLRAVGGEVDGPVTGPGAEVEEKAAAVVYRRLAGLLGPTTTADYREVPADGGRLLWTGAGWLVFEGEPTLPAEAGAITDLATGEVSPPATTARAPAWVAPR